MTLLTSRILQNPYVFTPKISIFYLVTEAEQIGLNLKFVGNPENRFCRVSAQLLQVEGSCTDQALRSASSLFGA